MHWLSLAALGGLGAWIASRLWGAGDSDGASAPPAAVVSPPVAPAKEPVIKPVGFTPPAKPLATAEPGPSSLVHSPTTPKVPTVLEPFKMNLNAPAAQRAILDAVARGECEFGFSSVVTEYNGRKAVFSVFTDALKLDGIRVPVTAITQQQIADLLDCSPLTTKLADACWQYRERTILPKPMGLYDERMQQLETVVKYNHKLDVALALQVETKGLVCNVGKLWVLDNVLETKRKVGANYGWFYGTKPSFEGSQGERTASGLIEGDGLPVKLIQSVGTHHTDDYTDYSQVCVLVYNTCYIDGSPRKLADVLVDPELAGLGNVGGVLRVLRQPGAPVLYSGKVGS